MLHTPHWLIKRAIFCCLEQLENSDTLPELPALLFWRCQ
ncbi:hypothetical protein ACLK1T_01080 [Escherichia coli]